MTNQAKGIWEKHCPCTFSPTDPSLCWSAISGPLERLKHIKTEQEGVLLHHSITISNSCSSGAMNPPPPKVHTGKSGPRRTDDILAAIPPLFRQDALMQGDRQKEQRRGFVAVCACSKRDLPCLDSTKHQHTPAQLAARFKSRFFPPRFSLVHLGLARNYPQATLKVSSPINLYTWTKEDTWIKRWPGKPLRPRILWLISIDNLHHVLHRVRETQNNSDLSTTHKIIRCYCFNNHV